MWHKARLGAGRGRDTQEWNSSVALGHVFLLHRDWVNLHPAKEARLRKRCKYHP